MILPKDNAFGIVRPAGGAPEVDTSDPGAFMQSALDTIVARYESQYAKRAEDEKKKKEQERVNEEVTNTFNSAVKYYRDRIESMNAMNFHRRQEKRAYSGVHNRAGSIVRNESFFTEDFLFLKVLFRTGWGPYKFVPPDLRESRAQGYWEGAAPVQLAIDDPPHVPLLASAYLYIRTDGKVGLCQMPIPLYGVEPDELPKELYLYCFYSKPRRVS